MGNKTKEEIEQQARDNQLDSAVGNKPGESASADVGTTPPQMVSATETEEQQKKQQAVAGQQPNVVAAATPQVQNNLPLEKTVTTTTTKKTGEWQAPVLDNSKFDENKAREEIVKSSYIKQFKDANDDIEESYRTKKEAAERSSRYNAWGNLLSAFGKLAGLGKNTYVKSDNKYLAESMKRAKDAKDLYDNLTIANKKALQTKIDALVDAQKTLFYKNQEQKNKNILKVAELEQKDAHQQTTTETTNNTYSNNDNFKQKAYEQEEKKIGIAQERLDWEKEKDAQKQQEEKIARAQQVLKDAYFTYEDSTNKKGYAMTPSQAGRLASIMKKYPGYFTEESLAMIELTIGGMLPDQSKAQFAQIADRFIRDHRLLGKTDNELEDLLSLSTHYELNPQQAPIPKPKVEL